MCARLCDGIKKKKGELRRERVQARGWSGAKGRKEKLERGVAIDGEMNRWK